MWFASMKRRIAHLDDNQLVEVLRLVTGRVASGKLNADPVLNGIEIALINEQRPVQAIKSLKERAGLSLYDALAIVRDHQAKRGMTLSGTIK